MEDKEQKELAEMTAASIEGLIKDLKNIPNSRDLSIAITKLEEANHRIKDFVNNV